MTRGWKTVFLWACSLGCAAGGTEAGGDSSLDVSAPSASSSSPIPAPNCTTAGVQSCYCPDGSVTGTQQCLANGTVSPCMCGATSLGASATPQPGAPVCTELAGKGGCMAQSYESQKLPASILFVVDRSKSMECNPPPLQDTASCTAAAVPVDPTAASRWTLTVRALSDAFDALGASNASVSVGLNFFSADETCGVHSSPVVSVGPLTDPNLTTLHAILDGTSPGGGTPIVGATILAYQHMHEEAGAAIECPSPECPCASPPCGAGGNRYVVLITDGEESCAKDAAELDAWIDRLLDVEAPRAVSANVRTFVIGAPGSEPARGYLSELAFRGGTAQRADCVYGRDGAEGDCHFDMTRTEDFGADLARVLENISGRALGCEFGVPTAVGPDGAGNVNVQLTSGAGGGATCFARDEALPCDGGANGWQYARRGDGSADFSKVVLCGEACGMVEADPGARVDVLVGCESLVVE